MKQKSVASIGKALIEYETISEKLKDVLDRKQKLNDNEMMILDRLESLCARYFPDLIFNTDSMEEENSDVEEQENLKIKVSSK